MEARGKGEGEEGDRRGSLVRGGHRPRASDGALGKTTRCKGVGVTRHGKSEGAPVSKSAFSPVS